jgi:succinyl-CoA synthetase alpha subunit
MAIFLTEQSRVLVQGITGSEGTKHTRRMVAAGTSIVAGVTPGKGGQTVDAGSDTSIPVFGSVAEAVKETGADVSVVFVPPRFAKAAVVEAVDAGVPLCVIITEGIPVHDTAWFYQYAVNSGGTRIVGPNCPGIISPGRSNAGIIPADITRPGRIGLVSKSGTLTYQMMYELRDVGFSTCVGIGGDPIIGTNFIDCLAAFEADPETDAIVMIGEIGGTDEQNAAAFVKEKVTKPVMGFIAGQTAPKGRRMGHAGAIISGSSGTAEEKLAAFEDAGIGIMRRPVDVVQLLQTRKAGKVKSKK